MEAVRAPSFWVDLKELVDYFDDHDAEARASRLLEAVQKTIESIEEFPDLGERWTSTRSRREGLRVRMVIDFEIYIILYRREPQKVTILRVVDARRDLDNLL